MFLHIKLLNILLNFNALFSCMKEESVLRILSTKWFSEVINSALVILKSKNKLKKHRFQLKRLLLDKRSLHKMTAILNLL